jgi:FlaA1/EpsC-like NDP-sugar epimerase
MRAYSLPELFLFSGPVTRLIQRYVGWFLWDFLIVFTSISITGSLVRLFGPLNIGLWNAIQMAFMFSMICSLVGILLNLNRIMWSKATPWNSLRLWLSWTVVTAAALILHHFYLGAGLATCSVIVGASLLSLAGVIFIRYQDRLLSGFITRLLLHRVNGRALREHVLVVGSGRPAEHVAWLIDHPTYAGKFQVIGFIDDDIMAQNMEIYGARVIGRMEDIQRIVKEHDIGLIFLADSQMAAHKEKNFRDLVSASPAKVVFIPDIFGSLSGLEGSSQKESAGDEMGDFQCQYCIARHAKEHEHIPA